MARPHVRLASARRSKYGAVATTVDNIRFHSAREARRYKELKLLERAGEITDLVLQPRFDLWAAKPLTNGYRDIALVGAYVGDFKYRDQRNGGVTVVEDVKGLRTRMYQLKKKIVEACHGIQIREI
jgi:uncharacterized protein DUF1064